MKLYIADAFTDSAFGGNPAGVILLDDGADFPSDKAMIQIAAELRYSETAFIKRVSPGEFNTRYFTPVAEVDLCGHATIATFSVLLEEGYIKPNTSYTNHTLAGSLEVKTSGRFILMEMGTPKHISTIDKEEDLLALYKMMGIDYEDIFASDSASSSTNLLPMVISTGLPDIILPVKDRLTLAAISPDFDALSRLSQDYNAVGVHAFSVDQTGEYTAFCRNFAPLYDIDEEAATGTANGALTYYLYSHKLIGLGAQCTFAQGLEMQRPSKILSTIQSSDGGSLKIQVGGSSVILVRGEIAF